jgi:mRNA degradation ribonuclease J1/J2
MLKFTGTGSAFNPELGNLNAYIRNQESLLLIDCGGTVFDRLLKNKILDNIKNLYILITHTHPDHIGSLGDTIFYSYYALGVRPVVVFPEEELLSGLLKGMGVQKDIYDFVASRSYHLGDVCLGSYEIEFYPASHVENIPSYGIKISSESKSVYFSGDSNAINTSVLERLKSGELDILYQDTCELDYEGNYHLSLRRLTDIIEPGLRSKVYCMHLDRLFDVNKAKNLGFNVVESEYEN